MKTIVSILCLLMLTSVAAGLPESPAVTKGRVEVGKIDAVVLKQVLPRYPYTLFQRGLEGSVVLEVAVDAQGKVVGLKTLSATDWDFAIEARRAVWQWQFAKSALLAPDDLSRYRLPVEFRIPRG